MTNSETVLFDQTEFRSNPPHVVLALDEEQISELFGFLQSGFFVAGAKVGCSVSEFLTVQLGISPDYIRGHISTIFLDGKPVDNLESALIRHGSHLALSSALPGLVGATMRQGSVLASLRGSITYSESGICSGGEGVVHLKLFNLVMYDLGLSFLERGILVNSSELKNFLHEHNDFLKRCMKIIFNNEAVEIAVLNDTTLFGEHELIKLSVQIAATTG
jgi:hypothetical protein